jgi:sugar phosphate isomerase/epimerase
MKTPDTKIGVTLFNLRDYCKTAQDLDDTLAKVKEIGYQAVQVSGVSLDPEIVKEKLDKYGLYVCATHESLQGLRDDFGGVVKKLKLWECDFTAIGSPGEEFSLDVNKATKLISDLDEFGRKFAAEGIKFGYHNHHFEFAKAGDKLFLEKLYDETDPKTFYAEIDVHWIQRGGQTPSKWIRKVSGRMPVCHFKDFAIIERDPHFCEIGEGNLDWPEIIKACEETNVRWYVVEQDRTFGDKNIFESIKISYDNMIKMGIK